MGWKIRKDKPEFDADAEIAPASQGQDVESTPAQLPDASFETEPTKSRPAFVLDLDNDAFRTDSRHTSLDTSAFGWNPPAATSSNDNYKAPTFDDPEPSFVAPTPSSLRDEARAVREESHSLTAEILSLQNKLPIPPPTPEPPKAQDFDLMSYMQSPAPAPSNGYSNHGLPIDPGGAAETEPAAPEIDERHIYSPNTYSQPDTPYREPEPSFDAPRAPVGGGFGTPSSDFSIPKVSPFIVKVETPLPEAEMQKHSLVLKLRNLSATYPLEKEITTIGRPDSDTQNYPDIEIDLDDGVSRKHAEVRERGGNYFVVDVGSTNGTLLNGEQIREFLEVALTHGDHIRVGERTEIVFE